MTDTPVWLLDIDGVINAVTSKPDRNVWPRDRWITVEVKGFPILAAKPVLDFIHRVRDERAAEIRWHTTWQHDANELGAALGLPRFPVQPAPEYSIRYTSGWWKLPAAERVLNEERRRLLWTDDDADLNLHAWTRPANALVISPDMRTGLCKRHLRQIAEWLGMEAQ